MYSVWGNVVVLGLVVAWLSALTFLSLRQGSFLKSLFPKTGKTDFREKLEEVLKDVGGFKGELEGLKKDFEGLKIEGLSHLQKIELLRFNPYQDTGGNISFTIAMLDNKGTGIILTSLHARSGTRIFAKPVFEGKSKYELSSEEETVLKKTLNG